MRETYDGISTEEIKKFREKNNISQNQFRELMIFSLNERDYVFAKAYEDEAKEQNELLQKHNFNSMEEYYKSLPIGKLEEIYYKKHGFDEVLVWKKIEEEES